MVDPARLAQACQKAREDLLAERHGQGHWVGELSSSALSTATAISALALCARSLGGSQAGDRQNHDIRRLRAPLDSAIAWLVAAQNADGGWGDTPKSTSNIATTMLAQAALHLADVAPKFGPVLEDAARYVERRGGIAALRQRYGKDRTFAVPILTNCALAGLTDWKDVAALPFELACFPQSWFRLLRLPVVSYAIPALVAIGQARFVHRAPRNPLLRWIRKFAQAKSLRVLKRMQPASGGFLEATPLTSFVVMSLASIGQVDHPVCQLGIEFLLRSVREDGSWPIDTNLATWVTTLSIQALASGGMATGKLDCLDWLLQCQHRTRHPYTGAAPGGWGWSDLSGAVPDADDTPGALLSLATLHADLNDHERERVVESSMAGIDWLLGLQNRDGGWPTFCRGWGLLPFDRSGTDLTAHAIRALHAWLRLLSTHVADHGPTRTWLEKGSPRMARAIDRGFTFLAREQRPDGSFCPLWFGNQFNPLEENPIYGTARVLLAYRDLDRMATEPALKALAWLASQQNGDGGWGGGPALFRGLAASTDPCMPGPGTDRSPTTPAHSSVEETALAVDALLGSDHDPRLQIVLQQGLGWLVRAVETGQHRECSPIGFYFAKLWYYERLYPQILTVQALSAGVAHLYPRPPNTTAHAVEQHPPQTASMENT